MPSTATNLHKYSTVTFRKLAASEEVRLIETSASHECIRADIVLETMNEMNRVLDRLHFGHSDSLHQLDRGLLVASQDFGQLSLTATDERLHKRQSLIGLLVESGQVRDGCQ